jgi:FkbM family methyltransferase
MVYKFLNFLWVRFLYKLFKPYNQIKLNEINLDVLQDILNAENMTIIEIGANDGKTTNQFVKMFPSANILCFEPDPRAIAKFKLNVKSPKVNLFEGVVSNNPNNSFIDFYPSKSSFANSDWDLSGSIEKPELHLKINPHVKFEGVLRVQNYNLNDFIIDSNIKSVDLIWMDIQGAEYRVLKSIQGILPRVKYIFLEYNVFKLYQNHHSLKEIMQVLPTFEIFKIYTNDVLFRNSI